MPLLLLLCLCLHEPAIAENVETPTIVELDWIEVNRWVRFGGEPFEQLVFWRTWRDRHTREHHTTDCGWCYWKDATLYQDDDGKWKAFHEARNTLYVATGCYWTETDFDPEMAFATDRAWW